MRVRAGVKCKAALRPSAPKQKSKLMAEICKHKALALERNAKYMVSNQFNIMGVPLG